LGRGGEGYFAIYSYTVQLKGEI
jgi:hypothetical protein